MGYIIDQTGGEFFLPFEHTQKALKAIKALPPRDYSWARWHDIEQIHVLRHMLEYWGYKPDTDEEGNIVKLSLTGEKLGEEIELFKAIAPFVKVGSYLEMSGEEGDHWRWVFDGETCKEVKATVSW